MFVWTERHKKYTQNKLDCSIILSVLKIYGIINRGKETNLFKIMDFKLRESGLDFYKGVQRVEWKSGSYKVFHISHPKSKKPTKNLNILARF